MKKIVNGLFVLICLLTLSVLFGCEDGENTNIFAKSEGVLTYAEYEAIPVDNTPEVVIETFIQAKQGWWENEGVGVATFYTEDRDGGYFLYNMPCSKADYDNKLVAGAKIKVTGKKTAWSGEVEIIDATWELMPGRYIATAKDLTDKLGSADLIKHQNQVAKFNDLTVVESGENQAFLYNWDGSGDRGSDLYFNVTNGTDTFTFVVESYLMGKDTDVYKKVEALHIGDVVDLTAFIYWYNGPQPHVTNVQVTK